jgi:hypothetical protein
VFTFKNTILTEKNPIQGYRSTTRRGNIWAKRDTILAERVNDVIDFLIRMIPVGGDVDPKMFSRKGHEFIRGRFLFVKKTHSKAMVFQMINRKLKITFKEGIKLR